MATIVHATTIDPVDKKNLGMVESPLLVATHGSMMLKAKGKVLVVDDNEDVRLSTKLLLERAGYEVATAQDGNRALDLQRELACQVLVTDIFMPEADGMETIERFRKEFPAVKIVAMSAGGRQIKSRTYLDTAGVVGADAALQKPFEPTALLETLRSLLTATSGKIDS